MLYFCNNQSSLHRIGYCIGAFEIHDTLKVLTCRCDKILEGICSEELSLLTSIFRVCQSQFLIDRPHIVTRSATLNTGSQ